MATNDEKRRVAAALKHYAYSDIGGGLLPSLKDAAEVKKGTWRTLFLRLADLIDPGLTEVNGGVDGVNGVDGAGVDRDALLALASGLEADADRIIMAAKNARFEGGPRMCEAKHDAYEWRSIARCIREACGEVA